MTDGKARGKGIAPEIGDILGKAPDPSRISDTLTYFYIKRIKGWMDCPVCGERLLFAEEGASWDCERCDFSLSEAEFLDNYVFWFCDGCGNFLNAQEGFDRGRSVWVCTACGHENDITPDNLKGICRECGELLDDPNASFCPECEKARLETAARALAAASEGIEDASGAVGEGGAGEGGAGEDEGGASEGGAGLETALPCAKSTCPNRDECQSMV